MILRKWEELPEFMRTEEVRPYYEVLRKKRVSLFFKRAVDLVGGVVLLVLLALAVHLYYEVAVGIDVHIEVLLAHTRSS